MLWKTTLKTGTLFLGSLILAACATQSIDVPRCSFNSIMDDACSVFEQDAGPHAALVYDLRTWLPDSQIELDPVAFGQRAEIPIQHAHAKLFGPSDQDALRSLAAKVWMIENAKHTIDFGYYIFKRDLVGYAMIGAMCDAVKRGVDIRVLVDSVGSIHTSHTELKALETCQRDAGYMLDRDGNRTSQRARIQVVIFNAVSRLAGNINRRSHDKILLVDGQFDANALLMTGGRNISVSYYGVAEDGSFDPHAYRDMEIVLRPNPDYLQRETVGTVAAVYYSLLFMYHSNLRLIPLHTPAAEGIYQSELTRAYQELARLKNLSILEPAMAAAGKSMSEDFRDAEVLLAHELANLTSKEPIDSAVENLSRNPNSIMYVLDQIDDESATNQHVRVVSPYLFMAEYRDKDGALLVDEAAETRRWLEEHPNSTVEIITNSVLTSDNIPAQAIIDMSTAPRLLLSEETRDAWLDLKGDAEMSAQLTSSAAWREQVNNSRLKVYEAGRLDAAALGGENHYGKLHAKFFLQNEIGFIGTSNFDYRSRLFNNEMGFFFRSGPLAEDLNADFEILKANAYLWGSPAWLELRSKVMERARSTL